MPFFPSIGEIELHISKKGCNQKMATQFCDLVFASLLPFTSTQDIISGTLFIFALPSSSRTGSRTGNNVLTFAEKVPCESRVEEFAQSKGWEVARGCPETQIHL